METILIKKKSRAARKRANRRAKLKNMVSQSAPVVVIPRRRSRSRNSQGVRVRSRSRSLTSLRNLSLKGKTQFQQSQMIKASLLSEVPVVQRMLAQFANPLLGVLQRARPGGAAIGLSPTALMSTHQTIDFVYYPASQVTATLVPTLGTSMSVTGALSGVPLWDFGVSGMSFPIMQFWDPLFPIVHPGFNMTTTHASPVLSRYGCSTFTNAGYFPASSTLVVYQNPGIATSMATSIMLEPTVFTPGSFVGPTMFNRGPYVPVCSTGQSSFFFVDATPNDTQCTTTINVQLTPQVFVTSLTNPTSTMITVSLFRYSSGSGVSDPSYTTAGQAFTPGTALAFVITVLDSGYYQLQVSVSAGYGSGQTGWVVSLSSIDIAIHCGLMVQTCYVTNTALATMASLVTGARLLGETAQVFNTSAELVSGGRIIAAVTHGTDDDWYDVASSASTVVANAANSQQYNGPLCSTGGKGGGIYSIGRPQSGFFVDEPFIGRPAQPGGIVGFNAMHLRVAEQSFGLTTITLRPASANQIVTTPQYAYEGIFAQALEYTTNSQAVDTVYTTTTVEEYNHFLDLVSRVPIFCENPSHWALISKIISGIRAGASSVASRVAQVAPMLSPLATMFGHPELSAALTAVGGVAGKTRDFLEGV